MERGSRCKTTPLWSVQCRNEGHSHVLPNHSKLAKVSKDGIAPAWWGRLWAGGKAAAARVAA